MKSPLLLEPIMTLRSRFMQEMQNSPPFTEAISACERRSHFVPSITSKRFIMRLIELTSCSFQDVRNTPWAARFLCIDFCVSFSWLVIIAIHDFVHSPCACSSIRESFTVSRSWQIYTKKILDSKRGSKKLSRNIAGMWLRIYCRHPADLYCWTKKV